MKSSTLFVQILAFVFCFFIIRVPFAGTIECSYNEDITNNTSKKNYIKNNSDTGWFSKLKDDTLSFSSTFLNSVLKDKFFCVYKDNTDIGESTKKFYSMLKTREIIPVFLYEGLASKFYEEGIFIDINTPFTNKRDEEAGRNSFVFSKNSVKSNIKYFGFYYPETGNYIFWYINKKQAKMGRLEQDRYNMANEYIKNRDSTRTVQDLLAISKFGELDALDSLCKKYYNGEDVRQDYNEAHNYCKQAGDKGSAQAQYLMGAMYDQELGVQKDDVEAAQWYTKASENGFAPAQSKMAFFYFEGSGVKQDFTMSFQLATKAAKQNDSISQALLGFLYENGLGTNKNESKALENYQLAADNDHSYAQFKIGNSYEKGLLGLQVNYKEAEKWYRKSARSGNKDAEAALSKFNK